MDTASLRMKKKTSIVSRDRHFARWSTVPYLRHRLPRISCVSWSHSLLYTRSEQQDDYWERWQNYAPATFPNDN